LKNRLFSDYQNGGSSGFDYSTESVEKMLEMHTRGKVVFQIPKDLNSTSCPKFTCILSRLNNPFSSNSIKSPFDGKCNGQTISDASMIIKFVFVNLQNENWIAGFSDKTSTGGFEIRINEKHCNSEPQDLALVAYETLVHELYHAVVASKLIALGWSGQKSTKKEKLINLIKEENLEDDIDISQNNEEMEHEYILLTFLDEMVDLIREMNQNKIERDYHLAGVLSGFGNNATFMSEKLGKSTSWILANNATFINLIKNEENVSDRFKGCP